MSYPATSAIGKSLIRILCVSIILLLVILTLGLLRYAPGSHGSHGKNLLRSIIGRSLDIVGDEPEIKNRHVTEVLVAASEGRQT